MVLLFRRSAFKIWNHCCLIVVLWYSIASTDAVDSSVAPKESLRESDIANLSLESPSKAILDRAEQALLQYNEWTSASPISMDASSSSDSVPSSLSSLHQLWELEQTYAKLVHEINAKQMKKIQSTLSAYLTYLSNDLQGDTLLSRNETNNKVSLEQLERSYLSALSNQVSGLLQEAVVDPELQATLAALFDREQALTKSNTPAHATCLSVEQAAVEVHAALMRFARDGIGLVDRAGYIVHQYTSPTYIPANDDATRPTLGNAWWRRFIPQDWEALLPVGWRSWTNVFALPDHWYHTFRLSGASTAPTEAVLEAATLPGHCWPVSMQSSYGPPIVTIGLTESIDVSAISIDHASKLLLEHPEEQIKSAPKRLKVYGYPPCDVGCHSLGFDASSKYLLTEIFYDISRAESVQTFPVTAPSIDSAEAASCSAVKETCGGDLQTPSIASAVSVEVVENWGKEEYTCLYRIRIHGEPIK